MKKLSVVVFILIILSVVGYAYLTSIMSKIAYDYKINGIDINLGNLISATPSLGIKLALFVTNLNNFNINIKEVEIVVSYKGEEIVKTTKPLISIGKNKTSPLNLILETSITKSTTEIIKLYQAKQEIPLLISFYGKIKYSPWAIKLNDVEYIYKPS